MFTHGKPLFILPAQKGKFPKDKFPEETGSGGNRFRRKQVPGNSFLQPQINTDHHFASTALCRPCSSFLTTGSHGQGELNAAGSRAVRKKAPDPGLPAL
jgi:hypothetical protein